MAQSASLALAPSASNVANPKPEHNEASMLTSYIRAAMRQAGYEILDDSTYYGEIPGFQGVYANAKTLEACREELQEVLEGWIILGLRLGHILPVVDGIQLDVLPEAA
jgi:predicted RNase H-like HicB family nuclease